MQPLLECLSLSKSFRLPGDRSISAVVNASLTLTAGQSVVINGPSGSGKTTLLMMAAGMLSPTSGSVRLAGRDLYALRLAERVRLRGTRIGVVLPMFHLLPYLDAVSNVVVGDRRPGARQRAMALLERVGLAERAHQLPDRMSAGERRRLVVARALVHRPEVLLADEPTANLDEHNATLVRQLLLEATQQGAALLVVTHDPAGSFGAAASYRMRAGALEPIGQAASA